MARTTLICVDTYIAAPRGKLKVGRHHEVKTPADAMRKAEFSIGKGAVIGALAYSIEADHEFEDYSEPVVLGRFGQTPDE